MYKYFAWVDRDGYQRSQELLPREVINRMIINMGRDTECFYTIQDYTKEGEILGGFPVFDIDNADLTKAKEIMYHTVMKLKNLFNVDCASWFSGSKGYHIYIPIYINHHRWHDIMKVMVNRFDLAHDPKIYRTRSMIRVPNSLNSKSGRHKTAVHPWVDGQTSSVFTHIIDTIISELPEKVITTHVPVNNYDLLPCVKKLWEFEDLPVSGRNQLILILVKAFHNQGLDADTVEDMFDNHPAWSNYSRREYVKVITSIYRSGRSRLGCRTGEDAEVLRSFCDPLCFLNEDLDLFELADVG